MSYRKLRGAIREKFGTQEAFAKALGKSETTVSAKLSGKSEWTKQEIMDTCKLLGIPIADATAYFFTV